MTRRAVVTAAAAGLGLMLVGVGSPSFADKPFVHEVTIPGDRPPIPFACGDLEGEIRGTGIERIHHHNGPDGTTRFLITVRESDAVFVADGTTYRVVGNVVARGYFPSEVPEKGQPPPPDTVLEFRRTNLIVLGPQGQVGSMHERVDGMVREVEGDCDYVF